MVLNQGPLGDLRKHQWGFKGLFKGIVHPKKKILSSFTHPQAAPNQYEFLCSAEHKGRYSEEWGKQSSSGAPLTSIVFFFYYWSQWCPKQPVYKLSSKYLPLCSYNLIRSLKCERPHTWGQKNPRFNCFAPIVWDVLWCDKDFQIFIQESWLWTRETLQNLWRLENKQDFF